MRNVDSVGGAEVHPAIMSTNTPLKKSFVGLLVRQFTG
jgi:hypothetical protein